MSELPSGWAKTTLGDVLQFNYGKGLPERNRSGSGFPVYGSNGVVGYHEKALVSAESLVVGRKGSVGEVHHSRGPCWPIDTTYFVDEFSGMPTRFWYYALKGLDLGGLNRATAIPGLNREDAYQVDVALPPQTEQKRIADKLDAVLSQVDACRQRLDRIPALLKRFRQAVLDAATSGELTEEWREENARDGEWPLVALGSAVRDFSYGSAAKSSKSGSVPVLRMGNIQDGRLDWSDLVYTSNPEEISKYRLTPGDVLFNRTNSPELVGKTAVYWGERDAIYAGYLIRVRCTDRLLPDYLNYCLNSPAGRDYCWRVKSDGVSQSNINAKKLAAFEFGLPAIEEQTEIVRRVEALFAYADRLEARYSAARVQVERLTPALLDKAFLGQLVQQDPNDEPASVLLERIRAARAAAGETAGPKRRKGGGRPKTSQKAEVLMLTRKDVQDTHLTMILKERGPLTAEALWSASQLNIDEFYDQLKDEEARGLLREKRGDSSNAPRTLEAA